jgi:uncharacterized UBP type Zn finger protein
MEDCTHTEAIHEVTARTDGCEECLQTGDRWVHLRMCMTCGHVGCCDSSPNRHASKHALDAAHPIVKSFEPGEEWGWCYVDEVFLEADWPVKGPQHHSAEANLHRVR